MADVAKRLYEAQPGTADTLLYTAPSVSATIVRGIRITNVTALPATIRLGLNAGAALGVSNAFVWNLTIPANGEYDWSGFQVVDAGGTIRALQGTAGALTVTISGVEQ